MKRGSWSTRNRASSRTSIGIASRVDAAKRMAGTMRVVISRLTDARRPTARRLRTPTTASTTTTSADVRNIFEASRMFRPSLFARARLCRRSRRSELSRRELRDEPPLIVEDQHLDDEGGTSTMDDLGLGCQGPPIRISEKVHRQLQGQGKQLRTERARRVRLPHGGARGGLVGEGDDGARVEAAGELRERRLEVELRHR